MGIISFASYIIFTHLINYKIALILSILIAVFVYGIQILIVKIPEVDEFTDLILKRIKR